MEHFDLEAHLQKIYTAYPEGESRPVIGITANYSQGDATLRDRYYRQVEAAGGIPVIIPPIADRHILAGTLDRIDGLLLTGGGDYNPLWTGEEPQPQLGNINAERDLPELLITRLAFNRQLPMLGICRGMQTLAIALGGSVAQHAEMQLKHSQDADRQEPTHSVTIGKGSMLSAIYAEERIYVNSFHHQAVTAGGPHMTVTATAADGVVEAIESSEQKGIIGVQWHPEQMAEAGLPLFRWLVEAARTRRDAVSFHQTHVTLDSHCDTPMFFAQDIDFLKRDPRILYDLHKMDDGHVDAVSMVCYLPQPAIGERFSEKVGFDVDSPSHYADLIFDHINDICQRAPQRLSIARTPADVWRDKREGRHSILLGIENGIALEHNLRLLKHFKQRGVTYITLCHNGDNDICDSARGCNTHNGLSKFGREVIAAMNGLGIMIDLSHAAETSFYQALEASSAPIVCSHSNCRALCNHPRNLTDDQMRALAAAGGVMQLTLYHGFLKLPDAHVSKVGIVGSPVPSDADITDFIRHLEHAVSVMGIDHVGIGTDFDGDGGIKGLRDASELVNLTETLMRHGFSQQDIAKIWGHNWLRVMAKIQGMADVTP